MGVLFSSYFSSLQFDLLQMGNWDENKIDRQSLYTKGKIHVIKLTPSEDKEASVKKVTNKMYFQDHRKIAK